MEAALAVGLCGTVRLVWGIRRTVRGIEKGKRGRRAGDQLILTEVEARRVSAGSDRCRPDAIAFALWTAQAVRELT